MSVMLPLEGSNSPELDAQAPAGADVRLKIEDGGL